MSTTILGNSIEHGCLDIIDMRFNPHLYRSALLARGFTFLPDRGDYDHRQTMNENKGLKTTLSDRSC